MRNFIRILIVSGRKNDCEHILDILSLQNNIMITGVVKDEAGAIIKTELLSPDVLILDIYPSQIKCETLAPIIRRRSPSTAIVLLCKDIDENYAARMIKAGVSGFLLNENDMDKLIPAIEIVFLGGYFISASVIVKVFVTDIHKNKLFKKKIENKKSIFSLGEQCIITDLAKGYSDREIAIRQNYNEGTIKNSIAAMKRRTKLKTRIQIVIKAIKSGVINVEEIMKDF